MAKALMKPQMSTVHMSISPVSKLTSVYAPNVYINGIPWKVEARNDDFEDSLAVYLHCEKEDKSSNWAVSARATVRLLAFGSYVKNELVDHIPPNIFDSSDSCFGTDIIDWDYLLADGNKHVKDDTIQLMVEITAEDPNYADRSILKFETIDKCCDHGSHSTFRLTVENIENLIAVRSPQFTLRGLPWDLMVYKKQNSYLGIKLSNKSTDDVSCDIGMSVEVISLGDFMDPIEKSDTVENSECLKIDNVILWDDLLKSGYGFVKNNAITLEVKLKADRPDGDVPDAGPAAKRHRLECSICLEDPDIQDISSATPCGHIFCTACIKKAVKSRNVCPMCSATVKNIQRVYLPVLK